MGVSNFFEMGITLSMGIPLPRPAGGFLRGIAEFAFDDRLEFVPLRGELYDLSLEILLGFTEGDLFSPEGEDRRDPLPKAYTQEDKSEEIADDLLQKIRLAMPTEREVSGKRGEIIGDVQTDIIKLWDMAVY